MNEQHLDTVDRMVDGELDDQQQRALLLDCEARGTWRELALAYVESQALKQGLSDYLNEPPGEVAAERTSKPLDDVRSDWNPWSLAAAVLIALGLGYGMGKAPGRDLATVDPEPAMVDATPESEVLPSSMQFMVSNPTTNELSSFDLPLVKASELGGDLRKQLHGPSPDEYFHKMRDRGVSVHRRQTITPVRMENGQRVLVPIDYYLEQHFQ